MKKIICVLVVLVLLVSLSGIIYAGDTQETKVTLKKVECTKSVNYQKFILKINDTEWVKIVDNDFESIWFEGNQELTVNDKTEVKIVLKRLVFGTWKNDIKVVKLEEGDNTINFIYGQCFNLDIIINLEIPTTPTPTPSNTTSTSPEVTPSASTDTSTPTPTGTDVTQVTVTPGTTPTNLNVGVDKLPQTGEGNPAAYILIGFCLLCSGVYGIIRYKLNKSTN